VRKQYHLRPGESGLDAWDVDRLVELSEGLTPQTVRLDSIAEIDSEYWFEASQPATVRNVIQHVRLIQEVDLTFPIILSHDGHVMDGMHRIARAILDGHSTIEAVQFDMDLEPDYRDCDPDDLPY
jgi:hypothetical protein